MTITACAGAPVAAPGPLAVESAGMVGPNAEVTFREGRYRGVVEHGVVELHTEGHELLGVIGSKRVQLHVAEEESSVVARGLYENEMGELRIDNRRIEGRFGECRYSFTRPDAQSAYEGGACCGPGALCTSHTTKTMQPGPEWETLTAERRVAVVALALEAEGRM